MSLLSQLIEIAEVNKLFFKGQDSTKYFRLESVQSLCYNFPTLMSYQSQYRQYENEWMWPHANKTLFTKTGSCLLATIC